MAFLKDLALKVQSMSTIKSHNLRLSQGNIETILFFNMV